MSGKLTRRMFLRTSTVAVMGAVLTACGGTPVPTPVPPTAAKPPAAPGSAATQAPAPTAVPTVATKSIVDLTVMIYEHPASKIITDGPAKDFVNQQLGIRLNVQPVPQADLAAKQNALMATKQVPDIMWSSLASLQAYADPSVVLPITPLADKYAPNLQKLMKAEPAIPRWSIEGASYLIPMKWYNRRRIGPVPFLRGDWMDELGLPAPTDFDQLYTVLTALKKAHPNSFWTSRGVPQLFSTMAYPFGTGATVYFEPATGGGQWLYGPIHDEYKNFLSYLAKAYKDGILDPDVATTTIDIWGTANSTDKGFFSWDNPFQLGQWLTTLRGKNPKASWVITPVIKGSRGARQPYYSPVDGAWCMGAGDKNPDRAAQLIDWLITPSGLDISNWGIAGQTYTLKCTRPSSIDDYSTEGVNKAMVSADCLQLTPDALTKFRAQPVINAYGYQGNGYVPLFQRDGYSEVLWDPNPDALKWYDTMAKDPALFLGPVTPPLLRTAIADVTKIRAAVDPIMTPAMQKVVTGTMTMSEYDKAIQDAIKAGAQDLEKIYNDAEAKLK
jgi:putative aldouronate transport system substrate-binding protein